MIPILGNLFTGAEVKNQPRHTENSDTRQEIQRHDPDQHRGKRRNKQYEEDDEFQDSSIGMISTEALRIFLENFLRSLENKKNINTSQASHTEETPQIPKPAPTENLRTSGRAAMAANAYQHMAKAQHKTSFLSGHSETTEETPSLKLHANDIRIIHDVLNDLKILNEKKINYIYIERGESFLDSIVSAVNAVKNSQSFEI